MGLAKRIAYRTFPLTLAIAMLIQPGFAKITEQQCEAIRTASKSSGTPWIGLNSTGELTPLKDQNSVKPTQVPKIVYLRHRDDGVNEATVFAIKLTFHTRDNERDKNWVRIKNNLKKAFSVPFDTYQKFHGGESDFAIKNNFHMSQGIFHPEIPFSTFYPRERLEQLRFAEIPENDEQTFRSYLIAIGGIQVSGSCVDFDPILPNGTKNVDIEVIDLLENSDAAVFYHESIDLKMSQ